jgi:hypothetical protein
MNTPVGISASTVPLHVAAAAIRNQCLLATDNRNDFPMPELQFFALP